MKTAFLLAVALATGLFASIAQAQPVRTFVASTGTDANLCSIAAPCRTLQRGIDAVASGGDVLIVDAGGFGSNVMITKSVSVFAPPGGQSRIAVASGSGQFGVLINASGISVSISNLGITGPAGIGVVFEGGTALSLSGMDINISRSGGAGVGVWHTADGGHLAMADTLIRNSGDCFIAQGPAMAPVRATIVHSRAENCFNGFTVREYATVSIAATSVSGIRNSCSYGFNANQTQATLTLDTVAVAHCDRGVSSYGAGTVTVSNSLLTGNGNAGTTFGGGIGRSYGNNRIYGNDVDTLDGFTAIAEQ